MSLAQASLHESWHEVRHEGLTIAVWQKCLQVATATPCPVLVLAHGSATGGRESFDCRQ